MRRIHRHELRLCEGTWKIRLALVPQNQNEFVMAYSNRVCRARSRTIVKQQSSSSLQTASTSKQMTGDGFRGTHV